MSLPVAPDSQGTPTRPYLIRALHDWCTDNGFTPYLAVYVDAKVQVPMEYVKNNEIVLNVGFEATSGLKLGNDFVEFAARFGGAARNIVVPIDHVVAIYARENGQGMAFPVPTEAAAQGEGDKPKSATPQRGLRLASSDASHVDQQPVVLPVPTAAVADQPPEDPPPPGPPRPSLKRIK